MPMGAIVKTVLFSTKSPLLHAQYNQECCDLLQHAFLTPAHGLVGDLPLLTQTIAAACNFEVAEVTRVENKALHDMHRQYAESYAIQHTRRVFHGTAQAHSIASVGFRGAASKRAKFGRGIYSSAGVFQALAYAELTPENTLTFVVAQLHLGPTSLGREGQVLVHIYFNGKLQTRPERYSHAPTQVDFGRDPLNRQILTLTNLEGDIFCASHGCPFTFNILHLSYISF